MRTNDKILMYLGIPVALALLLFLGCAQKCATVAQIDADNPSYVADRDSMTPEEYFSEINPPWEGMTAWPFDVQTSDATAAGPRALTDSESARMRTMMALQEDGIGLLTAQSLQEKLKSANWHGIVIDVGAKSAFMHSHVLGAINVPENQIAELGPVVLPDRNTPIVTYCGSTECTASMSAARELKQLGYAEVYDFWGGLKEWIAMGFPTRESEVAGK